MDEKMKAEYAQKYGELGAAALTVIEGSLVALGNKSLSEEGFDGRVDISFDIKSYNEQKGLLRFARQLEDLKKRR